MEPIILETLKRDGRVAERHRLDGARLRVGRSYDNELILDDPYVCPRHAELYRDGEGNWGVRDCDSVNGTHHSRYGALNAPCTINSGDEVRLGDTRLRVIFPGHEVAPALKASPQPRWVAALDQWVSAILALAALAGMVVYTELTGTTDAVAWAELAEPAVEKVGLVVGWAAALGLLGWLLKRRHAIAGHFSAAALVLLAIFGPTELGEYVQFWTDGELFAKVLPALGSVAVVLALLYASLLLATPLRRSKALLGSQGIGWGLVAIVILGEIASQPDFRKGPDYAHELKPPIFSWQPAEQREAFSEAVSETFDELEASASAEEGEAERDEAYPAGERWELFGAQASSGARE